MSKAITFTLDLEDHRPDISLPKRYPEITNKILDFLEEQKIKATIFTVGSLAEKDPDLIKKIHASGHEIAHHSYAHITLDKLTPEQFCKDTQRAKNILEDIIGAPVKGYRAPVFSLTRQTLWAIDILKELGFEYSSSILPAQNPLHGLAGAPSSPFQWNNGLLEIPAPVTRLGPFTMPYLGGFYLRYLPTAIVRRQAEKSNDQDVLWTYCHPYDFDHEEKNWRIKGASDPVSLLLWFNRRNSFKKMQSLANHFDFSPPLGKQNFDNLKIIDPVSL